MAYTDDWEFIQDIERWDPAEAIRAVQRAADIAQLGRVARWQNGRRYAVKPRLQFNTSNGRGWPCGFCGCGATRHITVSRLDYGAARPCWHCRSCLAYISPCGVCDGRSISANTSRICRLCRRLIARKEHELWLGNQAEIETWDQLEALRDGRRTLQKLRSLLQNPDLLRSAAREFELAKTSPTS